MNKKIPRLNIKWHTIKARKDSEKEAARISNMLSIYFKAPIKIGNVKAQSLAGLFLGIYYPENDSRREQLFSAWGGKVIRLRFNLAKSNNGKFVYWKEKCIVPDSKEHYKIIEQAIRAKFKQNKEAKKALISTHGLELSNNEGNNGGKHKIPPEIFCEILTKLRDEFVHKRQTLFFYSRVNRELPKFFGLDFAVFMRYRTGLRKSVKAQKIRLC